MATGEHVAAPRRSEGVLAAFAQFDNDVRSDLTRAGMRAALELERSDRATRIRGVRDWPPPLLGACS